jgi:kynurenine formamidase
MTAATRDLPILESLRGARVYDLEQPRRFGAPTFSAHAPGYQYVLHRRHESETGGRTSASGLVIMADHSGTHIDALCHQAEDLHLSGGRSVDPSVQTPSGFTALGVEAIAPILGRGVLLDVAGHVGVAQLDSEPAISAALLQQVAAARGLTVGDDDVVLVRTGAGAAWEDPAAYERAPGMARDASEWLAGCGVQAVGADNLAWDAIGVADPELGTLPGHLVLLVRHGIYIIENLHLEELSRDGVLEFAFVCLPLKLNGATGSPVRPVAVVS